MVEPTAPTGAKTMQDDYAGLVALTKARDTFLHYAKLHFDKGTPEGLEKAHTNAALAREMWLAIEALTRPAPEMMEKVARAIRDTDDPGPELAHVYARAATAAIGVAAPPERLPTEE